MAKLNTKMEINLSDASRALMDQYITSRRSALRWEILGLAIDVAVLAALITTCVLLWGLG